ncbi:MAG: hypothetical protein Q8O01_06760 [Candidatus Omnitrophota bacterium]|nr:hypothetical protein [Candidatus Omnitrophota bacterium]
MSKKLVELRSMPLEELIGEHDKAAEHTFVGINYYLDEISRRDTEKATNKITAMTFVMMVATIVNVILFWLK